MKQCPSCHQMIDDSLFACPYCGTPCSTSEPRSDISLPPAHKYTFVNAGLGFIPVGVFLLIIFVLMAMTPLFSNFNNLRNFFLSAVIFWGYAMGIVLTWRSKGPDLSMVFVMPLGALLVATISMASGSWIGGFLVALVVCSAIGLLNGFLSTYTPIPAPAITFVIGILISLLCRLIFREGIYLTPFTDLADYIEILATLIFFITFLAAFFLLFFTRLGKPFAQRQRRERHFIYILPYLISGAISALLGLYYFIRLGGMANTILGSGDIWFLLFCGACLYSSKTLDGRILPIVYCLAPVFLWATLNNLLILNNISTYTILIYQILMTLIMVAVALICQFVGRKKSTIAPLS